MVIVYESGFTDFSQERGRALQTTEPWLLHEGSEWQHRGQHSQVQSLRYNHPGHTLTPGVLDVCPENRRKYFVFQTLWLWLLQSYMFFLACWSFLSCHFVVYSRLYKVWFESPSSHISSFYIPLPSLFLRLSSFSCLLSHRSFFIQDWALGFRSKKDFSIKFSFWMIFTFYAPLSSILWGRIMNSGNVQRKVYNNLIAAKRFKVRINFRRSFSQISRFLFLSRAISHHRADTAANVSVDSEDFRSWLDFYQHPERARRANTSSNF